MKQPNNSIERFANKLNWKQSLALYLISALIFLICFVYCCKTMLFNVVTCIILFVLFVVTCVFTYVAMLSTVYDIIKDAEKIKKYLDEIENNIK